MGRLCGAVPGSKITEDQDMNEVLQWIVLFMLAVPVCIGLGIFCLWLGSNL